MISRQGFSAWLAPWPHPVDKRQNPEDCVTACPPHADDASAPINPPTSQRRVRAALVPVTSARAGTARRRHRTGRVGAAALALLLAAACGTATGSTTSPTSSRNAGPSPATAGSAAEPPSVFAWYANHGIHFAHTEASDRKIAALLTSKKNSPVIYVPQLAAVPAAAT